VDNYYKNAESSIYVDWLENVQSMTKFEYKRDNDVFWGNGDDITDGWPASISHPDKIQNVITGSNAFYNGMDVDGTGANYFVLPTTMTQSPFFERFADFPSSLLFGGIGFVSGHEIGHGFDSNNIRFDYSGSYVDSTIFTNQSFLHYQDREKCFSTQYSSIPVDKRSDGSTAYVNYGLTRKENLADNTGLAASWEAWQSYIAKNGNDKSLYGVPLTQEQMFFVGSARGWCRTFREGTYVVQRGSHPPSYARVIGPMQNSPGFAEAFQCKVGSRMNPANKCSIW